MCVCFEVWLWLWRVGGWEDKPSRPAVAPPRPACLSPARSGDHTRALQKLGELPFVPTERFRLQLCASGGWGARQGVRDAGAPRCAAVFAVLLTPSRVNPPPLALGAGVSSLHPAVADRLPAVLLAAAGALAASGKREQLQTVVAFAAAVPNRISQAVYQQLNQLQAGVA